MDLNEIVGMVEGILVEKLADLEEDERDACVRLWRFFAENRGVMGNPEGWAAGV
ncbi:MAG: hypothetical protein QXD45_03880 [Candidatus Bathyarchaeia archaeon]